MLWSIRVGECVYCDCYLLPGGVVDVVDDEACLCIADWDGWNGVLILCIG